MTSLGRMRGVLGLFASSSIRFLFLVGSSTGDGAFTGVGLTGGLTIVISCDSSSESDTSVSMISSFFSWIRAFRNSTSFLFLPLAEVP